MTTFFNYDDMTWDVVADLSRDTPLVLPLGSGYDLGLLASQLSHPSRIGLLSPFPFGWRGSGLAVPEPLLAAYVRNLLDSLRDDGFTRVYVLTPQGIDLGLGESSVDVADSAGHRRREVRMRVRVNGELVDDATIPWLGNLVVGVEAGGRPHHVLDRALVQDRCVGRLGLVDGEDRWQDLVLHADGRAGDWQRWPGSHASCDDRTVRGDCVLGRGAATRDWHSARARGAGAGRAASRCGAGRVADRDRRGDRPAWRRAGGTGDPDAALRRRRGACANSGNRLADPPVGCGSRKLDPRAPRRETGSCRSLAR